MNTPHTPAPWAPKTPYPRIGIAVKYEEAHDGTRIHWPDDLDERELQWEDDLYPWHTKDEIAYLCRKWFLFGCCAALGLVSILRLFNG